VALTGAPLFETGKHARCRRLRFAELAANGNNPVPGDNAAYRQARTELLAEEIELRRRIERVAAMRRALPPGGKAQGTGFGADGLGVTMPRKKRDLPLVRRQRQGCGALPCAPRLTSRSL